jgi:hypothetical protein
VDSVDRLKEMRRIECSVDIDRVMADGVKTYPFRTRGGIRNEHATLAIRGMEQSDAALTRRGVIRVTRLDPTVNEERSDVREYLGGALDSLGKSAPYHTPLSSGNQVARHVAGLNNLRRITVLENLCEDRPDCVIVVQEAIRIIIRESPDEEKWV